LLPEGVRTWFKINGIALIVGIAGGLGAILLRLTIDLVHELFFEVLLPHITFMVGRYNLGIVALPVLGGLIVGPIIHAVAPETKGHGVPEVIDAVQRLGGRIRGRVAAIKIMVSSITIGSGGSVGREGPIGQIGAAVGSFLGSVFRLSDFHIRLMVVCGLAAGISGTFVSPLGGAIFGIEVVYRGLAPHDVVPIFVASVVGEIVTGIVFGLRPPFSTPQYVIHNPVELVYFLPIGLIFGHIAIAWTRLLYLSEDLFDGLKVMGWVKPAIGGLMIGVMGMLLSDYGVLGVDYGVMESAIAGNIPVLMLLLVGVLKIVSTGITVGSGGSGGIFAPSLYIGAMLGAAFTPFMSRLPYAPNQPSIYSLVGMAALFAGAAKAPLTCIVMLPEITDNYYLLPVLMLACSASYFVSTVLMDGSIYTLKLKRRGVDIDALIDPLKLVDVEEIMTPAEKVISLREDTPASVASFMFWETKHTSFPVLKDERIVGLVTLEQLRRIPNIELEGTSVGDICIKDVVYAHPDETANSVIDKMSRQGQEMLPVVGVDDEGRMLGVVSRIDTLKALELSKKKVNLFG
jgi:CIC family chloride channel protein